MKSYDSTFQAIQAAGEGRRALGGSEQGGRVTGGHAGLAVPAEAAAARHRRDEHVQQRAVHPLGAAERRGAEPHRPADAGTELVVVRVQRISGTRTMTVNNLSVGYSLHPIRTQNAQ